MTVYREQIESLCSALRVVTPDRYRWFGEWSVKPRRDVAARLEQETRRLQLIAQVQARLYQHFYQPGRAVPVMRDLNPVAVDDNDFVDALAAANSGQGSWQDGWTVIEGSESGVWANRDGLTVWVPRERSRGENESIVVLLPSEFRKRSPGYFLVQGDEQLHVTPGDFLVRLYWNVSALGAGLLIGSVTSRLNAERVPFNLKVLNDPNAYRRNDAGVLYLSKRDLRRASHLIRRIYDDVHHELRAGVPALTRPLAPGLGLAEDPGNGESFGLHRCRLLAEAFVDAAFAGMTDAPGLLQAVEARFQREGLDLSQPYLNTGSSDDYDQIIDQPRSLRTRPYDHRTATDVEQPKEAERYLEIARMIGDRLVRAAIWHEGRCTWLGPRTSGSVGDNLLRQATYGDIGFDIYSGNAGIALFLAQLFVETGTEAYRATARGAIEQAIHAADRLFQQGRIGFYTGWPGIAVATSQVGRLIDDAALASAVPRQFVERFPINHVPHEMDLLSGAAGAALAFHTLWQTDQDERYLAGAVRFGEWLLAAAHHREPAAWWPARSLPGRRGLTGFAHGTAGIAFALLDLYRATADERFQQAAEAALIFERRNFHPGLLNWLDLRYPVEGSRFGPTAIASSVWCHGSGGIALSRLTAWTVLQDPAYLAEAQTAIQATSRWTEHHLDASEKNWSLCHGLAGNAAILWRAAGSLPDQAASAERLALRVANAGLATVAPGGDSAALCDTDDLGLMLGLAGIGHFYLTLANDTLPSVLVPGD